MTPEYPDSHYHRQLAPVQGHPPLTGELETDTCVVGGGLAGVSTALELAERGRSVILLEAGRIAWSASGRNGGLVSAGWACGIERLVTRLGRDHARRLAALSRRGVQRVRERIRSLGIHAAAPLPGMLLAWRYPPGDELLAAAARARELLLAEPVAWSREQLRAALRTARYFGALHDAEAFHFQPLAYTLGLTEAAVARGVGVHENSRALSLGREPGGWRVRTGGGSVRARHVVLAGSAHLGRLEPRLAKAVLPVATYMMATEPLGERLAMAIRTQSAVADTRNAGDYYRARDGRILWGGRMTTATAEPRRLAALLRDDLLAVYPQLAGVRVQTAWSGLMGYTRHRMPLVGPLEEGLWACTAFGGHGVNTTAACAELVARAIAEGDDGWRLLEPFGPVRVGGRTGRLAAQATYWYYRLGDRLRERRAEGAPLK